MFLYPFWLFGWSNNQINLGYISRRATYLIMYVQSSIRFETPDSQASEVYMSTEVYMSLN